MLVHGSPWPMHGAGGTLAWGAGAGNATAETFVAPSAMMANAMMMERMLEYGGRLGKEVSSLSENTLTATCNAPGLDDYP